MATHCKKGSKNTGSKSTVSIWLASPFLLLIGIYQYIISPMIGPRCRFEPTCSHYAKQALLEYGVFKGLVLAIKRLSKCHPWHEGGYDPLPAKTSKKH